MALIVEPAAAPAAAPTTGAEAAPAVRVPGRVFAAEDWRALVELNALPAWIEERRSDALKALEAELAEQRQQRRHALEHELSALRDELQAEWAARRVEAESALHDKARALAGELADAARRSVHDALCGDVEAAARCYGQALAEARAVIDADEPMTIHCGPADRPAIESALRRLTAPGSARADLRVDPGMAPGLCRIRAEGTMLEFDLGAWLRAVDRVLRDAADAALGVAPADDDNGDEATANGDADRTSIDASALDDEIPGSDDFAIGFDEAADDWQVDETPFEDETCEATPLDGSAADEASFDESDPEASDLEANDVDEAFVDEAFVDGALVDGAFDDDTPPGLRAAGSRSRHATGEPA